MANAIVRQEINILDALLSAAGGSSATSNEIVQLDTTQYNGATYYFEIEADSTISISFNVTLNGATDGTLATVNIPVLTTSYLLKRSASFTPTTATQNCTVVIDNTAGATKNVKAARIVIIQNATTLTNTETQIEVGNFSTTTSITPVPVTNPKYWYNDSTKWDGTVTAYFEATISTASTKETTTASLQVADGTGDGFVNWVDVTSSPVTTISLTAIRVRSAAITLTANRWYRVAFKTGSTKSAATIYNAKVIIDQVGLNSFGTQPGGGGYSIQGTGGTNEAQGQSFTTTSSFSTSTISLLLAKNNSPTDNLTLEVLTTSITGTVIATSNTVAASSLTTISTWITFTFGSSVSFSNTTKYYLRLTRSGARDTTNYITWYGTASSLLSNGGKYAEDSAVWGAESATEDLGFIVDSFTKLEPQYLLANTLFAAGTALQTFLTKWDSTEWNAESGSITYYFQAEAANGSTSDVTLEQADGGGTVTNSTLTNIDNGQISAAMTMPGDENLDTKATTNAGDVAAARILVAYVFAAAAAVAAQNSNFLMFMGPQPQQ